jgi:hypothetical protein
MSIKGINKEYNSMKHIYCLLILVTFVPEAFPQNYTRDAGVRFGEGVFASYRQFYNDEKAVEGMIGLSNKGLRVVILREYMQPFEHVRSENLKFIYGFGVHAGVTYTNKYKFLFRTYYDEWKWSPQYGLDGLAGFEYTLSEFPLLIRVAAQPYFEYSLNRYFHVNAFNFIISFLYRY